MEWEIQSGEGKRQKAAVSADEDVFYHTKSIELRSLATRAHSPKVCTGVAKGAKGRSVGDAKEMSGAGGGLLRGRGMGN